jgi:hypothetical protein
LGEIKERLNGFGGKILTVGELKKMLEQYPDDMEIVNQRYSDYQIISEDEWSVVEGVDKDGWVMRAHPTMSDDNKARVKKYLHLEGN